MRDENQNPEPNATPAAAPASSTAAMAPQEESPPPRLRIPLARTDRRHSLALLLICAAVYLPVMGSYGMFDPWETHYTEVARQFMVRNDWLSTYWHNGQGPEGWSETNFWTKPVGSFWLSGVTLRATEAFGDILGGRPGKALSGVTFGLTLGALLFLGLLLAMLLRKTLTVTGRLKTVALFALAGAAIGFVAALKPTPGPSGEAIATGSLEWAVRLPFFLSALFGAFCIYLALARLFSPRAGLLAGIITATAPMYFSIGRQAMTDMPYVGLMSGGLALFMLAVFGEKELLPRRSLRIGKRTLEWPHATSYYLFLAAFLAFMGLQLNAIIPQLLRVPLPFSLGGRPLSAAMLMGIYIALTGVFLWWSRRTTSKNEIYLYTFFMVVGIGGLSKGLIAALQPGLIVLLYLLTSREWRLLGEVALGRGLAIAVCVFVPWFHGMVARYGLAFWNELFGTEQFRRLTIGEQAQAKGTFEYYVGQIGYGLFPWVAFLPAALVRAVSRQSEQSPRERVRIFVMAWFAAVMGLFALTITKYHHYILPAIPPAAILIALYLDELAEGKVRGIWISLLTGFGVLAIITLDMTKQPARWVWMYTYLYEQVWAQGVPKGLPILIWGILAGVALLLFFVARLRRFALWATVVICVVWGGYVLNWYQLAVAPHWSQKRAVASYYKHRKSADEQLVAWQFNWRGETWYSGAEVIVSKSLDNTAIIAYLRERPNRRFFFITERGRYPSLQAILPSDKGRRTLKIVDDTNIHYVLASADL